MTFAGIQYKAEYNIIILFWQKSETTGYDLFYAVAYGNLAGTHANVPSIKTMAE